MLGMLTLASSPALADVVRYRYVPVDNCGRMVLKPGPDGAAGEWQPYRGAFRRAPYPKELTPTQLVTFKSPYTNGNVVLPLALPEGTPRMSYGDNRVTYSYGVFTVDVYFFEDRSAEVIYNSGLLRPL
jgi:hypothetical protein